MHRRPRNRRGWEDDSDSDSIQITTVDYSHLAGRHAFGIDRVPDVLYSIKYVDKSRRHYGTIGSNKKINVDESNIGDATPDSQNYPVIEIHTVAVCSPRHARTKLEPFRNVYHAESGESKNGAEEDAVDVNIDDDDNMLELAMQAKLQSLDIAAVRDRFQVDTIDIKGMVIHSSYLQHAINAVKESTVHLEALLKEPYPELYHIRDDLAHFRDNQPACHNETQRTTTAKHINVLLDYLQKELGDRCRDEERRYAQSPPMATFDMMWLLYKPFGVAYAKRAGRQPGAPMHWRAYVISSVDTDLLKARVTCWSMVYNAGMLRRETMVFTINSFSGEQTIQDLPLVPQRFFPEDLDAQDGLSMADWQIKLGRQYWDLVQAPAYKEYVVPDDIVEEAASKGADSAPNHTAKSNRENKNKSKSELVERVVVDVKGFETFGLPSSTSSMSPAGANGGLMAMPPPPPPPIPTPMDNLGFQLHFAPRCSCDTCRDDPNSEPKNPGRFAEFKMAAISSGKKPTNDLFYLLCDVDVPAFVLSRREWVHVHLARLQPVQTDHEAFENLVLDADVKTTVRALVGKFAHDVGEGRADSGRVAPWPRDIVKNKGEGRIFLLHGSPGVGKTCTAECIAELAQRPLLALTSGDISTDMNADVVERNLDTYLRLGERYGALVLLDEADVFLEARRASDLRRNGLVSVFLRALEYFRGVLFLTTNRVETFDDAFTSRIHVALHYHPLSPESRRRVWMQHFARIERDSGGRIFVLRSTREYAYEDAEVHALELNGREIRNALQTAVALAEADALDKANEDEGQVTVTEAHLRAVIKMSAGFKLFMNKAKSQLHE
ncbi:hypothetical protein SPBR_05630 [Sporothrix brasiliensis 5110]|uniref:AAA+ ATPase domain-containing protein n=1 Tax=Sporothrix brasiliensis 5110 TaxID=1398154 RepID=A0A0C2IZI5_9PEZI|nr:uncharacterized protein SPBR_05630 [Sporothrix brasiliensis 5110]KIH94526.1 hypothetical protein SPBR_05630 [Sporothrix brasiliensis 5110]